MRTVLLKVGFLLLPPFLLSACNGYGPSEGFGTVTGAVAGGLLGSTIGGGTGRAVAIGVGAVGGALVGGAIGRNIDESNYYYAGYYADTYPEFRGYYSPYPFDQVSTCGYPPVEYDGPHGYSFGSYPSLGYPVYY